MGYCKDCSWSKTVSAYMGLGTKLLCTLVDRTVSEFGTCNHFHEQITEHNIGYRGDSGGCFLTSACVDYLGKEDDCYELTKLRAFRDDYMRNLPSGELIINDYYAIAPKIVEKINLSSQKGRYYQEIYSTITDCIELIDQNNNEQALSKYKEMVIYYKTEFDL